MDIWQHKVSKKYFVQVSDTGLKLTLITPMEGLKTFDRDNFDHILNENIQSLYEKGLLTDSQIAQCKNHFPELSLGIECAQIVKENVKSAKKREYTEVTAEEFVKVLSYWITQVQLDPTNVEFIANNIKFGIPKLFKRKLLDFQNELISLFVSIAHICTIQYLGNKKMAKAIIEDVIRLISKIAFPSSSHNNKSSEKIFGWSAQVDERRKSYIRLCKEMNSNSFSSMGMLFLENFNYSKDSYLASVFLSTYIQQVYLELSDALRGYRIISL